MRKKLFESDVNYYIREILVQSYAMPAPSLTDNPYKQCDEQFIYDRGAMNRSGDIVKRVTPTSVDYYRIKRHALFPGAVLIGSMVPINNLDVLVASAEYI